jgi:Rrf2 family protein
VFSQTVEYALRATLYIARQSPRPVRLPEIADGIDAPRRYLGKILGSMARAGLLKSSRGPAGGFRLAPRCERASLANIAAVFESSGQRRCLLGHGVCGRNPQCTVHDRWAPIAESMNGFFAGTSISDLVASRTST